MPSEDADMHLHENPTSPSPAADVPSGNHRHPMFVARPGLHDPPFDEAILRRLPVVLVRLVALYQFLNVRIRCLRKEPLGPQAGLNSELRLARICAQFLDEPFTLAALGIQPLLSRLVHQKPPVLVDAMRRFPWRCLAGHALPDLILCSGASGAPRSDPRTHGLVLLRRRGAGTKLPARIVVNPPARPDGHKIDFGGPRRSVDGERPLDTIEPARRGDATSVSPRGQLLQSSLRQTGKARHKLVSSCFRQPQQRKPSDFQRGPKAGQELLSARYCRVAVLAPQPAPSASREPSEMTDGFPQGFRGNRVHPRRIARPAHGPAKDVAGLGRHAYTTLDLGHNARRAHQADPAERPLQISTVLQFQR